MLRWNQLLVEIHLHILRALAEVEIVLSLLRLLRQESEQMEEEAETDLAVPDGAAAIAELLQVLANAFHLAADEFIGLDGEVQRQQVVHSLPVRLRFVEIEGKGITLGAVIGACLE